LYAAKEEIEAAYTLAKQECQHYLSNYTIDTSTLPDYFPNPALFVGPNGQKRCRGTPQLYQITGGILAWPFGPLTGCPTYRKCWYGVLTCGKADMKPMASVLLPRVMKHYKEAKYQTNNGSMLPPSPRWSTKALRITMRVIGVELVVPEQRLLTLHSGNSSDDVIIAQYSLTHPSAQYQLEMRQEYLHLAALWDWDDYHKRVLGIEMVGAVYLGGSETRCRAFQGDTGCHLPFTLEECDKQAFVTGTPVSVVSSDGSSLCPEVGRLKEGGVKLPMCDGAQANPGRWIQSSDPSLQPRCDPDMPGAWPFLDYATNGSSSSNSSSSSGSSSGISSSTNSSSSGRWVEASGNPCLLRSKASAEELGKAHWFYAPYQCRYHFYTQAEARQCFHRKGIKNVLMVGDSMVRDLFGWLGIFFNEGTGTGPAEGKEGKADGKGSTDGKGGNESAARLPAEPVDRAQKERDRLKHETNVKKTTALQAVGREGLPTFHFGLLMDNRLKDFKGEIVGRGPLDLLVTNNALAHHSPNDWPQFVRHWEDNQVSFWHHLANGSYLNASGVAHPLPRYRVVQSAKALFGANRYHGITEDSFLRANALVRSFLVKEMGFTELILHHITEGKLRPCDDGLHFMGVGRQMEVVVLLNMLCNELLV
jgi:hypothetical protein